MLKELIKSSELIALFYLANNPQKKILREQYALIAYLCQSVCTCDRKKLYRHQTNFDAYQNLDFRG